MGANKEAAKGSNEGKVGGFKDILGGKTGGISDLTGDWLQALLDWVFQQSCCYRYEWVDSSLLYRGLILTEREPVAL